jgi:hypothetical protein
LHTKTPKQAIGQRLPVTADFLQVIQLYSITTLLQKQLRRQPQESLLQQDHPQPKIVMIPVKVTTAVTIQVMMKQATKKHKF